MPYISTIIICEQKYFKSPLKKKIPTHLRLSVPPRSGWNPSHCSLGAFKLVGQKATV